MRYYAAYATPLGELALKPFDTLDELARFVREQPEDVSGLLFSGEQIRVTKGPWRYLVHGQTRIPLFDLPDPDELELDDSSRLGRPPDETVDRAAGSVVAGEVGRYQAANAPPTPVPDPDVRTEPEEADEDVDV